MRSVNCKSFTSDMSLICNLLSRWYEGKGFSWQRNDAKNSNTWLTVPILGTTHVKFAQSRIFYKQMDDMRWVPLKYQTLSTAGNNVPASAIGQSDTNLASVFAHTTDLVRVGASKIVTSLNNTDYGWIWACDEVTSYRWRNTRIEAVHIVTILYRKRWTSQRYKLIAQSGTYSPPTIDIQSFLWKTSNCL